MNEARGANRIALEGDWDLSRRDELAELFGRLSMDREAVIDLSGCDYADSTLLSALAALRLKYPDVPVTLIARSANMRRMLQIANFDKLFLIEGED